MKVWVTRYALTDGIRQCEVKTGEEGDDYLYVKWSAYDEDHGIGLQCRVGRDCFYAERDAYARAADMAAKKLKSLQKSKSKIEQIWGLFAAKARL